MPFNYLDFLASAYLVKTPIATVDLSESTLKEHLLQDQTLLTRAQTIMSNPKIRELFQHSRYEESDAHDANNEIFEEDGFRLLSRRRPFYSVLSNSHLAGYIIKSGSTKPAEDEWRTAPKNDLGEYALCTEEDALLQIQMAKRIENSAKKLKIPLIVPDYRLVPYPGVHEEKLTQKYFIICKALDVLPSQKTITLIEQMEPSEQKIQANQLSALIKEAGIANATFESIRLMQDRKTFAILDTQPYGLITASRLNRQGIHTPGILEKYQRIGLFQMKMEQLTRNITTLSSFFEGIEAAYQSTRPKFSKQKIAYIFLTLGLHLLINAIIAFIKMKGAERACKQQEQLDRKFASRGNDLDLEKERSLRIEYESHKSALIRQLQRYTKGVVARHSSSV
jgi:hypothetical protein